MSQFRRVADDQAGPAALGVLVPPGRRTTIVLRPRALNWDLLPVRWNEQGEPGTAIQELSRERAGQVAEKLVRNLEAGTAGDALQVSVVSAAPHEGFWVRAEVSSLPMIVCRRNPGQPYRPSAFLTHDEAAEAAHQVAAVVFPTNGTDQELYFNNRNFAR
jgi:hypothetical protein